MAAKPDREIAFEPRPLRDWMVPVVWEAMPMPLFAIAAADGGLTIRLSQAEAAPERARIDPTLPADPDVEFHGRDETLLALDRAFDSQPIVLLHAWAGAGKTSTAVEFARWYQLTGGLADGRVLFTTFTRHTPLVRVLDEVGPTFGPTLEHAGVQWLTLSDAERRDVALQVLAQVPVLWIWDNVEPVAGFPAGTASAWTADEQVELVSFLRDLRSTKAKVLLTSRRDERGWLGDLPARVTLPPMPMAERVQLARAVAAKHGHRLSDVEDWRPLLEFTQGNPLTITVLVGQSLRDGLTTRTQLEAFVARLRAGAAAFTDDTEQGRDRSLSASLSYGLDHAFTGPERAQLALLHLFQGFVDVDALSWMGDPDAEWCMPEVRGLTRKAGIELLDRAAEIGLLTPVGHGCYTIHPVLPWFFRQRFTHHYGPAEQRRTAIQATRSYAEAVAVVGNHYAHEYEAGRADVISVLRAEEANLLNARALARIHGWWNPVIRAMQGLHTLYGHIGRTGEWRRLVDELVPDLVDPDTDGSLPDREQLWDIMIGYQINLAIESRDWVTAERLQSARVNWNREQAVAAIAAAPIKTLDDDQRLRIHNLATSVHMLGELLREQQRPSCVQHYEEAIGLYRRIGARRGEAMTARNLGNAYLDIPGLEDLDQAEGWYRTSLDLFDERDRLGRASSVAQLGHVALWRFREARDAGATEEQLLEHLNDAAAAYYQDLDLTPKEAVNKLAVTHHQLGNVYWEAGDLDAALAHYRESIQYKERGGNRYGAGKTRHNVAVTLICADRFNDALLYAQAALRDFEQVGAGATGEIDKTQQLIAFIEQHLA